MSYHCRVESCPFDLTAQVEAALREDDDDVVLQKHGDLGIETGSAWRVVVTCPNGHETKFEGT